MVVVSFVIHMFALKRSFGYATNVITEVLKVGASYVQDQVQQMRIIVWNVLCKKRIEMDVPE
jgi:hypothetical protein